MFDRGKKICSPKTSIPQIALLFSQFLFLTVLVGGLSQISQASFSAYEKSISPLYVEKGVSSIYD